MDGAVNQILFAIKAEDVNDFIHPLNEFGGKVYLQGLRLYL